MVQSKSCTIYDDDDLPTHIINMPYGSEVGCAEKKNYFYSHLMYAHTNFAMLGYDGKQTTQPTDYMSIITFNCFDHRRWLFFVFKRVCCGTQSSALFIKLYGNRFQQIIKKNLLSFSAALTANTYDDNKNCIIFMNHTNYMRDAIVWAGFEFSPVRKYWTITYMAF